VALAAAGLLTFSPFFLAQSRAYNQDALLGALMVVSALLVLVSLESGKRGYLVLSGFVAGLAFLSKMSGVFMVPYAGLVLLVYLVVGLRAEWSAHRQGRARWLAGEIWRGLVGPYLLWLLGLAAAFALWPAMWVEPRVIVAEILERLTGHLGEAHEGRFLLGRVYDEMRPPVLFYPLTFAFNSSFVTLTLAFVALGQYTLWREQITLPLKPLIFWLLVAYVLFFTIQMLIGSDQDARYIFPAYLMLEVLAAIGLVGVIELVQQATKGRESDWLRAFPAAMVALAVGMQALIALPFAPNYGAHHNQLLGGNRVAVKVVEIIGQNEGLNYVSDYLSQQPESKKLQIGAKKSLNKTLRQYFGGKTSQRWSNKDDYNLISVRDLQREPDYWAEKQAVYEGSTPQLLVIIDGVPYMWLYARNPPTPFEPVVIRRGGGVGFIVLAWVWTVALVSTVVWALRHTAKLGEEGRLVGR
jgi:4-amino-4-deoxy-L-arabinose transferase-like glycosyltransferase